MNKYLQSLGFTRKNKGLTGVIYAHPNLERAIVFRKHSKIITYNGKYYKSVEEAADEALKGS